MPKDFRRTVPRADAPRADYPESSHNYLPPDDPLAVAAHTLGELERAKEQGVFGIMRMRFEAWIEERIEEPMLRKMKTREKLLEAHRSGVATQASLVNQSEIAKRELEVHRRASADARRERLLSEAGLVPGIAPAGLPSAGPTPAVYPPLRPYLSDVQVEALARRFAQQTDPDREDFDAAWERFAQASGLSGFDAHLQGEIRQKARAHFGQGR